MNRGTLRTLLLKRLQDTVADQFDSSDANDLLNVGLGLLQAEIMKTRPDAFLEISTADIVAGQERYENPDGWIMDQEIEIADSSTSSGWRKLNPMPIQQRPSTSAGSISYFSHKGRWLVLTDTPTVAVTAGLRRTWVPTLTMSADADIPSVKTALHTSIVDYAVIEALGETDEGSGAAERRLERKLALIPDLYARVTVGQTYSLVPRV